MKVVGNKFFKLKMQRTTEGEKHGRIAEPCTSRSHI